MLLNDVGTLSIAVRFQMSLYDGCRPVYLESCWHGSRQLPHSLEIVVPILVLRFENVPLFCSKTLWLFSSKIPLFRDKTPTFQSKMNPFFVVKHWLFSPKLTPFSQNSRGWVPKYTFFLGKYESWISLKKNTPLFANFRTDACGKVAWVRELGRYPYSASTFHRLHWQQQNNNPVIVNWS